MQIVLLQLASICRDCILFQELISQLSFSYRTFWYFQVNRNRISHHVISIPPVKNSPQNQSEILWQCINKHLFEFLKFSRLV